MSPGDTVIASLHGIPFNFVVDAVGNAFENDADVLVGPVDREFIASNVVFEGKSYKMIHPVHLQDGDLLMFSRGMIRIRP